MISGTVTEKAGHPWTFAFFLAATVLKFGDALQDLMLVLAPI
jgi:hypothetical protein